MGAYLAIGQSSTFSFHLSRVYANLIEYPFCQTKCVLCVNLHLFLSRMSDLSCHSFKWCSTISVQKDPTQRPLYVQTSFFLWVPLLVCWSLCGFLYSSRTFSLWSVPPMIWVPNQLIGAGVGSDAVLTCNTEAFPVSINYWTKEGEDALMPSDKYDISIVEKSYKIFMTLRIRDLTSEDFTSYKCYARNALGSTQGSIKLYGMSPLSFPTLYLLNSLWLSCTLSFPLN